MDEWANAQKLVTALVESLEEFDWPQSEALTQRLIEEVGAKRQLFDEELATEALQALRRKRQFGPMMDLAKAFIASGRNEAEIHRQLAQAHIDHGAERGLEEAERILGALLFNPSTPAREIREARGLLGRIHKQRYVDASSRGEPPIPDDLRQAVVHYDAIFANDPTRLWHGINVVACLARAQRDGVDTGAVERKPPTELAREILAALQAVRAEKGKLRYWDRATSMEAHLAVGEWGKAIDDVRMYVRDLETDAFECFSTLRQLREVWQVHKGDGEAGPAIAGALESALLKRCGGEVQLQSSEIERGLQANFKGIPDLPLEWWRTGLERCAAIARIETLQGDSHGTGFLVRQGDFFGDGSNERLLLTNWHVVSENGQYPNSLRPEAARANFQAAGCAFLVAKQIVAYSRRLDATFLQLQNAEGLNGHCPIEPIPAPFNFDSRPRVYVIGHPGGRNLSFSIHDSIWLDTDGTKLHYRTPTEPGSSGSPVFDQESWVLLALHRAGLQQMKRLNAKPGTYQANEGHAIAAIQAAVKTARKS